MPLTEDRVVAFVGREGLEDYGGKYFGRPHLSYEQRLFLLRSPNNLASLAQTTSEKYDRGETSLRHAFGSTLKRLDIGLADLERGPRLEVGPLMVFDGAGFQKLGQNANQTAGLFPYVCGGSRRRTSRAGSSSRRPSLTTCLSRLSSVQVRNFTSATSVGRTQCMRLRTSGDPKRLPRRGGTSSGIVAVASGCSRRHNRCSSAVLMPVPARPA
jgi:hypothetical protein